MSLMSHNQKPTPQREAEAPEECSRLGRENALYLAENEKELKSPFNKLGRDTSKTTGDSSSNHIPGHLLRNAWKFAQLDPLGGTPWGNKNPQALSEYKNHFAKFLDKNSNAAHHFQQHFLGTYTGEICHLETDQERQWMLQELMGRNTNVLLSPKEILASLYKAYAFEEFCRLNFPGKRRFSLEGSEGLNIALDACVKYCSQANIDNFILGMAHRGRLNIMANVFKVPFKEMLSSFYQIETKLTYDDVPYHFGAESKFGSLNLKMMPNPSHLEAVDPVVQGYVRGLVDQGLSASGFMIHGNAAFSGQGVVYETLQMALLKSYSIGGCVHFILDNQVGFTARPEEGHSTDHSAAIGRAFGVPILHVNGDAAEDIAFCTQIALKWRERFKKDIIVRIVTYRKLGHNETDDASFTDPKMAHLIDKHQPAYAIYEKQLIDSNVLSEQQILDLKKEVKGYFKDQHKVCGTIPKEKSPKLRNGSEASLAAPMTGIPESRFKDIFRAGSLENILETIPDFSLHPKLASFFEKRAATLSNPTEPLLDWGNAEALAFSSLALDGHPIRLSGQDSERGTFSHRHSKVHCQKTGRVWDWMNQLSPRQGNVEIVNAPLSEYAALNFEYGYSLSRSEALCLWEAQFGDFVNGAQIAIDQFILSGEEKWGTKSSLTLLLPHGFEGAGPEHSSGRMERFLELSANNNCRVLNLSTAANYFHALRGQILRSEQKPCIIFTPKSLLRLKSSFSSLRDIGAQTRFTPIIEKHQGAGAKVAVLCTGKIYYDLEKEILSNPGQSQSFSVFSVEQLYPFPKAEIESKIKANFDKVIWLQEEPKNMGARNFILPLLKDIFSDVKSISRPEAASPATGDASTHANQQKSLIEQVYGEIK